MRHARTHGGAGGQWLGQLWLACPTYPSSSDSASTSHARLIDISELRGRSAIQELELVSYKKVTRINDLAECTGPRRLNIAESSDIESLSPVAGLTELEELTGSTGLGRSVPGNSYGLEMTQSHPEPSGHLLSALRGLAVLQSELLMINVITFQWPQEMDSGIDLVGFALVPGSSGEKKLRATAFVAGFQSKGSEKPFAEGNARSVRIDQHESYWKHATLPIFVTSASNDGHALLIEDAFSFLSQLELLGPGVNRRQSIPTTVSLDAAAADVRLRMFAHALAPWVSQRLRRRTLAAEDDRGGLNRQSTWSLLAYSGGSSPFPAPKSWADCRQYFQLLEYVYDDSDCRQELFCDLQIEMTSAPRGPGLLSVNEWESLGVDIETPVDRPAYSERHIAFELLGDLIMLCLRYKSLYETMPAGVYTNAQSAFDQWIQLATEHSSDPTPEKLHALQVAMEARSNPKAAAAKRDVDHAVEIVCGIWAGAARSLELTEAQLAQAVIGEVNFDVPNSHSDADPFGRAYRGPGWVLRAIESRRRDLRTALRDAFGTWASDTFYVGDWSTKRVAVDDREAPPNSVPFSSRPTD